MDFMELIAKFPAGIRILVMDVSKNAIALQNSVISLKDVEQTKVGQLTI